MIILTPIPVETKKALERGECVGQTIQESPWEVSVESVIGYEFVRDMQIKKTKIFPPLRQAIPIVGWLKYMGESALVLCQDLVQVKMSFSHSNLPAIPKLPVDTILQNHRVTYNRNDYEFVWYYKTFPSIQIPGGMHVCNC